MKIRQKLIIGNSIFKMFACVRDRIGLLSNCKLSTVFIKENS